MVDQTIALLLTLESHHQVLQALTGDQMALDEKTAAAAVAEAQRRLARAAGYDYTREFGRAVGRLNNLYRRSVQIQDCKTALGIQRELNRILGLGPAAPVSAVPPPGGADESRAGPDAGGDSDRARAHLALAFPDSDLPLDELARMAAAELIDTRDAATV